MEEEESCSDDGEIFIRDWNSIIVRKCECVVGAIGLDVWCFALRGKTGRQRHQRRCMHFGASFMTLLDSGFEVISTKRTSA